MPANAIECRGLRKRFGDTLALDAIDLVVPDGTIFGVLGPNGAGKTTIFRILTGVIGSTAGAASVLGYDVSRHRLQAQDLLGYLPGEVKLYRDLTGEQNLTLLGSLHSRSPVRRSELLRRFPLGPSALRRKVSTYSRGMLQMLGIIAACQHDPEIYLLDEPTVGLDPVMQATLVDLLMEEKRRGKTILLSSHVISEVERVCDRVAMIDTGRVRFEGSLQQARDLAPRRLEVVFTGPVDLDWRAVADIVGVGGTPSHHVVSFRGPLEPFLQGLVGLPVETMTLGWASLEEIFFKLYQSVPD